MSLIGNNISLQRAGRRVLDQVNIRVAPGQVHALLGPNGAGKSSLLAVLAGDCPATGEVSINDQPIGTFGAAQLARRRAVLPQIDELRFGFRVREVVAMGTLPWPALSAGERAAWVAQSLALTSIEALAERRYTQLSGGERARVQLARVLCQLRFAAAEHCRVLLLDEPTAHLDLAHQQQCLRCIRQAADAGLAILVVMHDPNLALQYADIASVLSNGRCVAQGPVGHSLSASVLAQVYGTPLQEVRLAGHRHHQIFSKNSM